MGGTTTTIDFSGRDYTTILERLQTKLVEELPELTDLNYSDAGQFLLRRLASESEYLHWYIDEAFYENFITTADQRQSLINLAALVDWKITLPAGASCLLRLTRKSEVTGNIEIPLYSSFARNDGTVYTLDSSDDTLYIMQSDEDYIDVPVVQGQRYTYAIQEHEFEEHDLSGLLRYKLNSDVASVSVRLYNTSDTFEWTEVDSFWRTDNTSYNFTLEYESDPENPIEDSCYLVLGSIGFPSGDTLTCSFNRTAGSSGNTGVGTILNVNGALSAYVTCSNTTSAVGGANIESIDSFKSRIPRAVRTQRRGVVSDDYEALVLSVPSVRFCQVIDRNDNQEIPHLYIKVFVVPYGGYELSEQIRNDILQELTAKGTLGSWSGRYIISEASQYPVNLSVRIGVASGYNQVSVRSAVISALTSYLESDIFGIGDGLDFSDLNLYTGRLSGVSWVEFDDPQSDITMSDGYIIVPGNISVTIQT